MGWRRDEPVPVTTEEAFGKLTIDHLRPLVSLIGEEAPKRKPELVKVLTRVMTKVDKVRNLYESLDTLAQQAVQEAAHHPQGLLQRDKFIARHGQMPAFSRPSEKKEPSYYDYDRHNRPTPVALFFPA